MRHSCQDESGRIPGTVYVFNRELQKDLTEFGAESFEFLVLEVLAKPEQGDNTDRLLAALELNYVVKLQPFGERGYNSIKGFQRDLGASGA